MEMNTTNTSREMGVANPPVESTPDAFRRIWHGVRDRILAGLLVILPIMITLWVIRWLYTWLEAYVIDPFAMLVLWKARRVQGEPDLPPWFENYAAPVIAIVFILALLYGCGFLAQSRLRHGIDRLLLRVPVISVIYDAVRNVLQGLDKPAAKAQPQRLVLIAFPHPGMRLPAFVTSTCRDIKTHKTLLCVYVPTTPVPTSGFFLMVPEDEVTELNWNTEQTLQAIISGGLTAPQEVSYFAAASAAGMVSRLAPGAEGVSADRQAGS
jgi:uncharacterized membrane protein